MKDGQTKRPPAPLEPVVKTRTMLTVFKYPVPLGDYFKLALPKGARVLSVDVQYGQPQLWALVNPDHKTEDRLFRFAGTGHPIEEAPARLEFVATFQMKAGSLIFHIFEVKDSSS